MIEFNVLTENLSLLPITTISVVDNQEHLGSYSLVPQSKELYELHLGFTPKAYGSTVPITKSFFKFVFATYPEVQTLIGMVPANNPLLRRLVLKCGCESCGVLPKSFKADVLIDQEIFYISREKVQCLS